MGMYGRTIRNKKQFAEMTAFSAGGEHVELDEIDLKDLWKYVRQQRKLMKVSREDLSRITGIAVSNIEKIEQGSKIVRLDEADRLLRALHMRLTIGSVPPIGMILEPEQS